MNAQLVQVLFGDQDYANVMPNFVLGARFSCKTLVQILLQVGIVPLFKNNSPLTLGPSEGSDPAEGTVCFWQFAKTL